MDVMRRIVDSLTAMLLLVVIAVTSVQLAAARGQSPAVGTMVICSGTGPLQIMVDENGDPTGGVMVCPDYALAYFGDTAPGQAGPVRADLWHRLWVSRTEVRARSGPLPSLRARGPPFFV